MFTMKLSNIRIMHILKLWHHAIQYTINHELTQHILIKNPKIQHKENGNSKTVISIAPPTIHVKTAQHQIITIAMTTTTVITKLIMIIINTLIK